MQHDLNIPMRPLPPGMGGPIDPRPCFIEAAYRSGSVLAYSNGVFTRTAEPTLFSSIDEGKYAFSRVSTPEGFPGLSGPFTVRLVLANAGSRRIVRERRFENAN
jgi:hypothetical protein